jgi:general secretion pathway protein C
MTPGTSLNFLQNAAAQQWLERASRTLPTAIATLATIAIGWELVQVTWALRERFKPAAPQMAFATVGPAQPKRTGVDVQPIIDAHLFGVANAEPSQDDGANAPPTQVPLVLAATLAGPDPNRGFAIIGESAQAGKLYKVGDMINGARLHSVFADKVILDRGGKLEALLLPHQTFAGAQVNAPQRPAVASTNPIVNSIRRTAETNPTVFAEVVRPQPVFAGGVQRGYRVYPGRNRQQFAKLGLQPGDLVLAVNGTPLDDASRANEIFNTIGSADHVSVTIERNGEPQELSLNVAQITLPEAPSPVPRGQPPAGGIGPVPATAPE